MLRPGFVFPLLLVVAALRVLETHHRSFASQSSCGIHILPHGDSSVCPSVCQAGGLDDLIRSRRRLSLSSHPSGFAEVPSFHDVQWRLPVQVLCFGLTTAPHVFTRVMVPVSIMMHRRGFRMLRYLDDWLLLASSLEEILAAKDCLLSLCNSLGIQVNLKNRL